MTFPRNINSSNWFKETNRQAIVLTTTTSGTGASGSFQMLPNNTIRISVTTATLNDAIYAILPFAIEVTDVLAVGKASVADAQFSLREASNQIASVRPETVSVLDRANFIAEDFKALAKGATLKVTALSTGGSAVITVAYVPG